METSVRSEEREFAQLGRYLAGPLNTVFAECAIDFRALILKPWLWLHTHQSSHGFFGRGIPLQNRLNARSRAKQAADELRDIEALLSSGPSKSVRLVHDSEGRAIGALIHDH